MDATAKKLIDAAGAGQSNMSPGWLTELGRLWGGTSVSGEATAPRACVTRHAQRALMFRPPYRNVAIAGDGMERRRAVELAGHAVRMRGMLAERALVGATRSCSHTCTAQDVPVADAKPEEIKELLGGALFKALYKWMVDSGPVYLLPTGGSARPHGCTQWRAVGAAPALAGGSAAQAGGALALGAPRAGVRWRPE